MSASFFNQLRDWINFVCEIYICWILTVEYIYDRTWNEHLKRKRRKKFEFDHLTSGEHR